MGRHLLVVPLAVVLLAGCAQAVQSGSSGAAAGDEVPAMSEPVRPVGGDLRTGQAWYLAAVSGSPGAPSGVTLTFEAERVAGQGPVNTFSAAYSASATGSLTFGPIASTSMAGPEEDMQAEAELLEILESVDGYTALEGGELYLFDDQWQVLTFSATPAPADPEVPDSGATVG